MVDLLLMSMVRTSPAPGVVLPSWVVNVLLVVHLLFVTRRTLGCILSVSLTTLLGLPASTTVMEAML